MLDSSRSGLAIHPLSQRLIKIIPDHTAGVILSTPGRVHVAGLDLCKTKISTDALVRTWNVIPPLLFVGFIPPNIRDERQLTN